MDVVPKALKKSRGHLNFNKRHFSPEDNILLNKLRQMNLSFGPSSVAHAVTGYAHRRTYMRDPPHTVGHMLNYLYIPVGVCSNQSVSVDLLCCYNTSVVFTRSFKST